jgi:hypothetical protein
MRARTVTMVAILSVALVFASAPAALARHSGFGGRSAPYRISKPSIPSAHVVMGVSFETTGVLTPTIQGDDTSTVSIRVFRLQDHRRPFLVDTVVAAISSSPDATGTAYDASITLPRAGAYALVAVVLRDGRAIASSAPRPVFAALPYQVSRPSVLSRRVTAGDSFDATGVVTPAIAADGTPSSVTVFVYRIGRHGRLSKVATATAGLTGAVGEGTGYSVTLSLPSAGTYVLVAVLSADDVVLGRSLRTTMRAVKPPVVLPPPVTVAMRH